MSGIVDPSRCENWRAAVAAWLRREADYARHAQANAKDDTDRLYRMGQKDGLLLAADAFERGIALAPERQSPRGEAA